MATVIFILHDVVINSDVIEIIKKHQIDSFIIVNTSLELVHRINRDKKYRFRF